MGCQWRIHGNYILRFQIVTPLCLCVKPDSEMTGAIAGTGGTGTKTGSGRKRTTMSVPAFRVSVIWLSAHLGYEAGAEPPPAQTNRRNGVTTKQVVSGGGARTAIAVAISALCPPQASIATTHGGNCPKTASP